MAVAADKGLSGTGEALHVKLVTDTVSGAAEDDAVLRSDILKIPMIVGVTEVALDHVVIHVGNRKLRLNLLHSHGLELEICHGSRGILGKGLSHTDGDTLAPLHLSFDQMRLDDLLKYCQSHASCTSTIV